MTEALSGRELEIAVARAFGWTAYQHEDGTWDLKDPTGWWHRGRYATEDAAWRMLTPDYLDDGNGFAEVMAALDGVAWTLMHRPGLKKTIMVIHSTGTFSDPQHDSETVQEATCRAFVAWKA